MCNYLVNKLIPNNNIVTQLIKITSLAINFMLNLLNLKKLRPVSPTRKSAGTVAIPKIIMPNSAIIGSLMVKATAKAEYRSPQGKNPRIIPRV